MSIVRFCLLFVIGVSFFTCKQPASETPPTTATSKIPLEIARAEKSDSLKSDLKKMGIFWEQLDLYLRAFKTERKLEVWVKNKSDKKYKKFTEYDFCRSSGVLGPKRKRGDRQIPEGLYTISEFNPKSNYFLSLKVSYPNESDRIRGFKGSLGGDIYIHGGCATIGCIPITNDKIKSLYVLAEHGKEMDTENIPIHIFPFRMNEDNMGWFVNHKNHLSFWEELKPFYEFFEETKEVLNFKINNKGKYVVEK